MKSRVYSRSEKSRSFSHPVNEDRLMICEYSFMGDEKITLLVIADGMGGLEDGEKAAADAVYGFVNDFHEKLVQLYMGAHGEAFSMAYCAEHLEQLMADSVAAANRNVCAKADPLKATGSTLSAVCILENMGIAANVGDSPIYFFRASDGELTLVSTLQTQSERDVAEGKYERYSGEYYANNHRLYCSLGQYTELEEKDICVATVRGLEPGDRFLMGSDGAFGLLYKDKLLDLILDTQEEGALLRQLFRAVREDEVTDDQTAILYVFGEDGT